MAQATGGLVPDWLPVENQSVRVAPSASPELNTRRPIRMCGMSPRLIISYAKCTTGAQHDGDLFHGIGQTPDISGCGS